MTNEIFEEFNAECVSRFLEPIINKESLLYLNRGISGRKNFSSEDKISHNRLIRLDNRRVLGKEFHI
ncbi:MAG: hypothetical protein ACTS73_05375 [Arsenophonus sp. NEOnobi-MAG3]